MLRWIRYVNASLFREFPTPSRFFRGGRLHRTKPAHLSRLCRVAIPPVTQSAAVAGSHFRTHVVERSVALVLAGVRTEQGPAPGCGAGGPAFDAARDRIG